MPFWTDFFLLFYLKLDWSIWCNPRLGLTTLYFFCKSSFFLIFFEIYIDLFKNKVSDFEIPAQTFPLLFQARLVSTLILSILWVYRKSQDLHLFIQSKMFFINRPTLLMLSPRLYLGMVAKPTFILNLFLSSLPQVSIFFRCYDKNCILENKILEFLFLKFWIIINIIVL